MKATPTRLPGVLLLEGAPATDARGSFLRLFDAALLQAAGLGHPSELGPEHVIRRVSAEQVAPLASLYRYLEPGELLGGHVPEHAVFQRFWHQARPDSFGAPDALLARRASKLV